MRLAEPMAWHGILRIVSRVVHPEDVPSLEWSIGAKRASE